jgi:hypothetical protein
VVVVLVVISILLFALSFGVFTGSHRATTSYVSALALARLCAQTAQDAISGFLRIALKEATRMVARTATEPEPK